MSEARLSGETAAVCVVVTGLIEFECADHIFEF